MSKLSAQAAPTEPAIVIEVRNAKGSVPREDGTWMWVTATSSFGTIGGGHLEFQAMAKARELLCDSAFITDAKYTEHFALGPSLGQCCGGALDLDFSLWGAATSERLTKTTSRFHLQLYGAGHVGKAIVRALAVLPCTAQWIDEREEFEAHGVDTELATHIEKVCVDSVTSEVELAPANSCYLVLTHSHALDLEIVYAILQREDSRFLGLIGSATKRVRFERQLRERGITEQQLQRLTCPIGLAGIVGKEPEIIAASVAAQLLTLPSI